MERNAELAQLRANLVVVSAAVADAIARIDALTPAAPAAPPTPSVDEYIRDATSATAVYKALEPELGLDRRTLLTKVERLVLAHGLTERFPHWSTDVRLARYLAERLPDGKRRLVAATEALGR